MKIKSLQKINITIFFGVSALVFFLGTSSVLAQNVYHGNPSNYQSMLSNLSPGDTLLLEAGNYSLLRISNVNGEQGNHITVTGPESGPKAVILGDYGTDTVEIRNSSYVTIKNLEINSQNLGGNGINSKTVTHDITLENLYIHDFADMQQTVGISANHAPSWNWIIRNNIIHTGGTGIYLGDSPGSEPFINGVIENNLIYDTIGYNMEIKHQREIYRPDDSEVPGIPMGKSTTIIRNNVFRKNSQTSSGGGYARPNLLVGHFPASGPGSTDEYHIYGNLFLGNPVEASFQGEGTVAFYNNIIVNTLNSGYSEVVIQPHKAFVREVRVFNNTIVSITSGIYVSGGDPAYKQKVIGNAVFASNPISSSDKIDNIVDSYSNASNYLVNPAGEPGVNLNIYPKAGMLRGNPIDTSSYNTFTAWNKDFNGDLHDGTFRGAYAGAGDNPGWLLKLAKKPMVFDTTDPSTPQNLSATALNASQISLTWNSSTDPETGIVYYKIYRNDSFIGQSTSTSYSDLELNDSTTYSYEVSAVNGMGLESDRSLPVSITTLSDTTPPSIVSVISSGDSNKVTVNFSEPLELASSTSVSNYHIDNNITVSEASLSTDFKTVTLTTSSHSEGINYTMTVNNIKDRATIANTILSSTQETYTFIAALLISNLSVVSGANYVWDTLAVGKQPYIDRSFTIVTVPSAYVGLNYLKTANNDKGATDNPFITFDVNQSVTVYVALSVNIIPKPSWLMSWTDTSEDLVTSDTTLHLYKKNFASGTVTLGGNEGGSTSMYSVVVKSASGTIDTTTPSPPTRLRNVK